MGDVTFDSNPSKSDPRPTQILSATQPTHWSRSTFFLSLFLLQSTTALCDRDNIAIKHSLWECQLHQGSSSAPNTVFAWINPTSQKLPNTRHCHYQLSAFSRQQSLSLTKFALILSSFLLSVCLFDLAPSSPNIFLFSPHSHKLLSDAPCTALFSQQQCKCVCRLAQLFPTVPVAS